MSAPTTAETAAPLDVEREILVCSYYRDAELHGASLLFGLLRFLGDAESQHNLTRHLADETRHAWLWTERIHELGGVPLAVRDGYQTRIRGRVGIPRRVIDLLALTVVVEQRALKRYAEHQRLPGTPARTLEVLRAVSEDESWHIEWIRRKGRELAEQSADPARFEAQLARYREIDRQVMAELEDLERGFHGP